MRSTVSFNDGWSFYKGVSAPGGEAEIVNLPHTWNGVDGQDGGDDYFDIYLDESIFTGLGDNKTIPDIWFELTQETECLEIGAIEGGYVVVLDKEN